MRTMVSSENGFSSERAEECLARLAAGGRDPSAEGEVISLLRPLGRRLVGRWRGTLAADTALAGFDDFVLRAWRGRMEGPGGKGERFDPGRGTFVGFVAARFRLRLRDHACRERSVVSRTAKTERLRRAASAAGPEPAGADLSLDVAGGEAEALRGAERRASDQESRVVEARIDLDRLLGRLPERDLTFLAPLVGWRVENLRGLAGYWRVSPAAVTQRMRRIRRRAAAAAEWC